MASIVLVGDSVLDNFYWLTDQEKDLRFRLRELGYQCENYAVDESTLDNVINGIIPNKHYVETRKYSYPTKEFCQTKEEELITREILIKDKSVESYKAVYPLELIGHTDTIVLSVGGNDLRLNILSCLGGSEYFIKSVLTDTYKKKYRETVAKLKKKCNKLILVSVYCPCVLEAPYNILSFMADDIMKSWLNFLELIACEFDVPILDLARTFDRNNRSHYGATVIEPSDFSNLCIAKCIQSIEKNYDGYEVFYAPNCKWENIRRE